MFTASRRHEPLWQGAVPWAVGMHGRLRRVLRFPSSGCEMPMLIITAVL